MNTITGKKSIHIKDVNLLIFPDKNWSEIEDKENPAFRKSIYFKEDWPDWKAVIVCKVLPYESCVGKDGFAVTDVSKNVPDVLRLGLFWQLDNAILFAEEYCKNKR